MTIKMTTTLMAIVTLVIFATLSSPVYSQDAVTSLRGTTPIGDADNAAEIYRPKIGQTFSRNYRQQPPLIPHKTQKYQINLKVNQCMACHDWPQNTEVGAPKISETHYIGRTGKRLNHVSTARWFCNQCHVPQVDAKALVPNTFLSAEDLH